MLIRAFTELSSASQVIVSTHTPMLARYLPDTSLRYIHIAKNKKREIRCGGPQNNDYFARTLGVLPDNAVKLFIGVEGPNDIKFLQNISRILCDEDSKIPDLEKMELNGELIFFPLGGCNLALWASRLKSLRRPEFHLFDRDVEPPLIPQNQKDVDNVNKREKCKALHTSKKEIENYLHRDAIIKAYKDDNINLTIESNFGPFDDVPAKIAKLVHEHSESEKKWHEITDKEKKYKESKAKRTLCCKAANYMNMELLNEIDPNHEILQWFKDIEELINQTDNG